MQLEKLDKSSGSFKQVPKWDEPLAVHFYAGVELWPPWGRVGHPNGGCVSQAVSTVWEVQRTERPGSRPDLWTLVRSGQLSLVAPLRSCSWFVLMDELWTKWPWFTQIQLMVLFIVKFSSRMSAAVKMGCFCGAIIAVRHSVITTAGEVLQAEQAVNLVPHTHSHVCTLQIHLHFKRKHYL